MELNWNNPAVGVYCVETKTLVADLSTRLQQTKANLKDMLDSMSKWYQNPLLVRDPKNNLIVFEDKDKLLGAGRQLVEAAGKRFQELKVQTRALFKASEDDACWRTYVEYMDQLVLDGLYNTVHCTLSYVLDNMEGSSDGGPRPLMKGSMTLKPPEIVFTPVIRTPDGPGPGSFVFQVQTIIDDVFKFGALVARLASHTLNPDYRSDVCLFGQDQ